VRAQSAESVALVAELDCPVEWNGLIDVRSPSLVSPKLFFLLLIGWLESFHTGWYPRYHPALLDVVLSKIEGAGGAEKVVENDHLMKCTSPSPFYRDIHLYCYPRRGARHRES